VIDPEAFNVFLAGLRLESDVDPERGNLRQVD
jgi:hypothetical protein